jgi:hypothetical protein
MVTIKRRNALLPIEVDALCYWIEEREFIRLARKNGQKAPWTRDDLLMWYRWCNVVRMDDRVSKWLLEWHRRVPEANLQNRLVALAAGRLLNWPPTLDELDYPFPYRHEEWTKALLARKAQGEKIFTGAYIINGALGGDKIIQVTEKVLQPLWEMRKRCPAYPETMLEMWTYLEGRPGLGSFMAGQIVADMRWVHPELPWSDKMTWAPRGPGSIRGANRLIGQPLSNSMPYNEWLEVVQRAMGHVAKRLPKIAQRMELMDMQNCLCEYDKYQRLKRGEGSVRAKYHPNRIVFPGETAP